ncbi:MAG: protein-L-isoaspartate O-methyltransferase [Pseudomonadota bacterium]
MTDFTAARTAMVDRQIRPSDVTSFPIIEAMLAIPRERFAPEGQRAVAYADAPLDLGGGREALDPRAFAKMIDGARIGPDDLVLDLAPGLGYSTAVIARMAAAVIAIEPDEAMAAAATETLSALEIDNALVKTGAVAAGDPDHAPFDAIFVNGGTGKALDELCRQLKDGGRLVAVDMSGDAGKAVAFIRNGDDIDRRPLFDAAAAILPGFEAEAAFAL